MHLYTYIFLIHIYIYIYTHIHIYTFSHFHDVFEHGFSDGMVVKKPGHIVAKSDWHLKKSIFKYRKFLSVRG